MARPPAKAALALIAVLTAALAVTSATAVSGAAPASKLAKRCTHGRVLVKVNKRSTCRPLRSVLPKPRAGDRTLIALREALTVDVSTLKGRHGKRARKLPRRAATAARKARKVLLRALPAALRMIAEREGAGSPARSRTSRARASARRCGGPGSAQPVGDPGHTSGAGVQELIGPHGEHGAAITTPVMGFTFKMTFVKCGTGGYYVLGCPKSNGDANTSSGGSLDVTERIMDGSTLIRQESTSWKYDDRLLGKVMADAHLSHFDFVRREEKLRVASGGFVQQGTATRRIRVTMPSGRYDIPHSSTSFTGDAEAFNTDDLAASIEMAIEEYKAAQNGGSFLHDDGWASENRIRDPYCAKAVFDPAGETVSLAAGQAKTVSVYAQGKDGGRATGARWTVMDPINAVFTPGSPSGANPTISYTVSQSPSGDHVRVTLKFTSTAGVGKDTWSQPIGALYLGEVTGTSQWDQGPCPDATHESLGYSAKLEKSSHTGGPEQPFALVDAQTIANPGVGLAAWGNGETGNGSFSRDACDSDPGCSTSLTPAPEEGHGHVIFSVEGATVKATARTWSWKSVDQEDCFLESGVPVFGVGTFPLSDVGKDTIIVPLSLVDHSSEDGFTNDFVGQGTLTLHRVD
jgi:hypothetical protein